MYKFRKLFIIPVLALSFVLIGCGFGAKHYVINEYGHSIEVGEGFISDDIDLAIMGESEYEEDDVLGMFDAAMDFFTENFKGCTMFELYRDTRYSDTEDEYAEEYGADDLVIMFFSFTTDDTVSGYLSPNTEYDDWNLMLVKNEDGEWYVANYTPEE